MVSAVPDRATFTGQGFLRGVRRLAPMALLSVPYGVAYGAAAADAGLSPLQVVAMSALVFSATAQFAALDFLREPVAFGTLALTTLVLSSRHLIMGAALSPWVNALSWPRRTLTLGFLSDPNFADTMSDFETGRRDLAVLLGGGAIMWLQWVASTGVGATGGVLVGDTSALGLGVVMVCFFAATVVGQWRAAPGLTATIAVAVAVALLTIDLLPAGWNIIAAALAGGVLHLARA
jgi:predicted branched-subunit amino acid permease